MLTTLVLTIPEGIIATLCSYATPKKSYEEGSETPKKKKTICREMALGWKG